MKILVNLIGLLLLATNTYAQGVTDTFDWPGEIERGLARVTPQNYSHLQQSPILLLMGEQDVFYTNEEVNTFYEDVTIQEKKIKYFESGHILPETYVNNVITWIMKYTKE